MDASGHRWTVLPRSGTPSPGSRRRLLASGRRGRRFKSGHPDQNSQVSRLFAEPAAAAGPLLGAIWEPILVVHHPRWSLILAPVGVSAEFGPGRRLRHRRLHGFPPRPVVPGHRMYRRRKRGAVATPRARAMVAAEASACVLTTGWPHGIFR